MFEKTLRKGSRNRKVLVAAAGVAAVVLIGGVAQTIAFAADGTAPDLLVSARADRSGAVALAARPLSGKVAVFLSTATKVREVRFYLDDPSRSRAPLRTERAAAYDFNGTADNGSAIMFDTTNLGNSGHNLTAVMVRAGGATTVVNRTMTISNGAATPPGPTTPAGPTTTPSQTATASPTRTATATPSPSSSGAALPKGNIPGWNQVYTDDFTGTALGAGWGAYSGNIPSTPGGVWKPSHVTVKDGKLRLLGYQESDGTWATGGVMNYVGAKTTYGKYLVRFRIDKGNGVKYAILTWPQSGVWPRDGEIDFAEDGGGQRTGTAGTLHWQDGGHQQVQRSQQGDFSEWHTLGVEWNPTGLVYTIDGRSWAKVDTPRVPTTPMNLAIQTESSRTCSQWMTCIDSTTPAHVDLEVDWVAVYVHA